MCGQADLLIPFLKKNSVFGVELDKTAYILAVKKTKNPQSIIQGNAFDKSTLSKLDVNGYDIVITNPPFIRRENYKKAISEIEGTLPLNEIYSNIEFFLSQTTTLTQKQKNTIRQVLKNISGLSDIAAISLILCIILTKKTGKIALVVPDTWVNREYSVPILNLIKDFFCIEYIINDVNSVWFDGIAQVKTSLVVARRVTGNTSENEIKYVDLFKDSLTEKSLTSFVDNNTTFKGVVDGEICSIPGKYERKFIRQIDFASSEIKIDAVSKLNFFCNRNTRFTTLESYGIACGQGFRSGANACFIFTRDGDTFVSKIGAISQTTESSFFVPIIQKQKSLNNDWVVSKDNSLARLLCIPHPYATLHDINSYGKQVEETYKRLPSEIENYILASENEEVNGIRIPDLSAVKTNIKRDSLSPRFWYNFPSFSDRHRGKVFLPRVNGEDIVARMNPNDYIVDANFITFWKCDRTPFNEEGILALLNSSWFSILCEETGSVMGGGALKLDGVQVKKMPFPILDNASIESLCQLGARLKESTIDRSNAIINDIDRIILRAVGINSDDVSAQLSEIKWEYKLRRAK